MGALLSTLTSVYSDHADHSDQVDSMANPPLAPSSQPTPSSSQNFVEVNNRRNLGLAPSPSQNFVPGGSSLLKNPMAVERNRLATFVHGYGGVMYPMFEQLASRGFVLNQSNLNIQCYVCQVTFDYPRTEEQCAELNEKHGRSSPHCQFLKGTAANVPSWNSELIGVHFITSTTSMESMTPVNQGVDTMKLLKSESERLKTFIHFAWWPVKFISPEIFARAGFFSLQNRDAVECVFCRGVTWKWTPGDDPFREHQRLFPRCPFIRNMPVGNIPIDQEGTGSSQQQPDEPDSNEDTFDSFDAILDNNEGPRPGPGQYDEISRYVAIRRNGPSRLDMVSLEARLKTFKIPIQKSAYSFAQVLAERLAQAGFYHLVTKNNVRCFYCHALLYSWETIGAPWYDHVKCSPACIFVHLNKGGHFVKAVDRGQAEVERLGLQEDPIPGMKLGENLSKAEANEIGLAMLSNLMSTPHLGETKAEVAARSKVVVDVSASQNGHDSDNDTSESMCSANGNGDVDDTQLTGEALEEEVTKLREAQKCKICLEKPTSVVFLPCSHLVSCSDCIKTTRICGICGEEVRAFVKTFMS